MNSSPIIAFLLGCYLVFMSVQGSSAIKCYSCDDQSGGCQDEFDEKAKGVTEKSCALSCIKLKKDGKVSKLGCLPSVLGFDIEVDECREQKGAQGCICDSDLCNASNTMTASIPMLTTLVFVVAILNRW